MADKQCASCGEINLADSNGQPREHSIRVGVKAVIIRNGMVLLVKYDDENGPHYNYPGGGHQSGESVRETVAREVLEETCAEVDVGDLLLVFEIAPFKTGYKYGPVHHLNLFFECSLKPGSEPGFPERPDPNEVAVEWIPYSELGETRVNPGIAAELGIALAGARPILYEETGQ